MKRILAITVLVLALAGCGIGPNNEEAINRYLAEKFGEGNAWVFDNEYGAIYMQEGKPYAIIKIKFALPGNFGDYYKEQKVNKAAAGEGK